MSTETRKLQPGDRVEMTEDGYRQELEGRAGKPCYGKVIRWTRDHRVVVVREGMSTEGYWHPKFWTLATPEQP